MLEEKLPDGLDAEADERVPVSKMRRAVAAVMCLSAQVPQFTIERIVGMDALRAWREDWRERGVSVSYSDVLTAACARALRAHPHVNASFEEDEIVLRRGIHIGLAQALPDGLIAPAIWNADRLDLPELEAERKRLRDAATRGKLRGPELYGATFTISNLGPFGVDRFRALVIPPQAAILAVGSIRNDGGELHTCLTMSLSLSGDHRVLDAAPAAEFLAPVVQMLEQPQWADALLPQERTT